MLHALPHLTPSFEHPRNIWKRVNIMNFSLCSFLLHRVRCHVLDSNILPNTMFSKIQFFSHSRVEAGSNISTVVPASRKRRRGGNTVSDETVMYGYWSSVIWPVSGCTVKLQTRPLFRESALQEEKQSNCHYERIRIKSGHGPHRGARYQDELVDWPSAVR
jgi:hypothetical protein